MAKQSRVKKYQGQLKRENSLLKRALVQAQQSEGRTTALLLALLVQAGGDLTISQATSNTMRTDIVRMGYKMMPTEEGLVKVVLVMQEQEPEGASPEEIEAGFKASPAEQETDGKIILTD